MAVTVLIPGFSHRLSAHLCRMALRLQSPTQNVDVWALPHPPGNSALVGVLCAWNSVFYNFQMVLRLVTNCSPKEVARLPDPESLVFLAQSPSLHTILLKTADWKMLTLRNCQTPSMERSDRAEVSRSPWPSVTLRSRDAFCYRCSDLLQWPICGCWAQPATLQLQALTTGISVGQLELEALGEECWDSLGILWRSGSKEGHWWICGTGEHSGLGPVVEDRRGAIDGIRNLREADREGSEMLLGRWI